MSRFVGSPEDRFFHDEAHFYVRHSSPICILLSCSIPVVGWYFFIRVEHSVDLDQLASSEAN